MEVLQPWPPVSPAQNLRSLRAPIRKNGGGQHYELDFVSGLIVYAGSFPKSPKNRASGDTCKSAVSFVGIEMLVASACIDSFKWWNLKKTGAGLGASALTVSCSRLISLLQAQSGA